MALFLRTAVFLIVLFALSAPETFAQTATSTPAPSGPTATAVACVQPPHGVVVVVENPSPGDTLISGQQIVINGVAYDTRATAGSGVSSVTVYLGSRDAGGTQLGTASLGQSNPTVSSTSQFANAGWSLRTPVLPAGSGGRSIWVYAKSSIDSSEGSLEVPVYLNQAPTPVRGQVPTPVLPPPPVCTPVPTATPSPAATSTPAPAVANTNTPTAFPTPTPINVISPLPTAPAAPAPVAPAPAVPAAASPPPANPPAVVAPAGGAATTAPRGGGIPTEVGLVVLALGAAIVGGGVALRRRGRRHS